MSNLAGLHDIEATAIAAPDTWILDTIAISESPVPKSYPSNLNVIVRVNWGYGSAGTLPLPSVYDAFAELVAAYVNGCSGCHRWIIGNEPNLSREWPDNTPIYPWHYAACYKLCWQAIHALPGHSHDEVLIAASGPWNNELKYDGNANGDWVQYFADTIDLIGDACDGYSIHSYTHGYDVNLVTSSARMDWPFHNRYYEFYTYRDYCEAIPPELRYLPVYLTEANGNGPWQAVGLMPAMLQEIDSWNHSKLPKIHCVIFYRYPKHDQFYIEGRGDVIAEYQRAVALGYQSPITPISPAPEPEPPRPTPPDPEPPRPTPAPEPEPISWDRRLTARGCTLQHALMPSAPSGHPAPLVKIGRWFSKEEAQGRVNVYVRLLDAEGRLAVGVPVTWFWSSGSETKLTERKSDPWLSNAGLGTEYSLDFAMYEVAPSYGIRIEGYAGDIIDGCGLGSIEQPDYKIHTAYFFEWQLSSAGLTPPDLPPLTPGGELVHPLPGAVITQHWGQNEADYRQFGMWGHNGVDLGGRPLRTPIRNMAAGIVAFSDFDPGYGHYVRMDYRHLDAYVMYCHLDEPGALEGIRLEAGDTVGLLGSSGNSSGPHLHTEIRLQNKDGTYREDTPMPKGRVDPETWCCLHGLKL